VADSGNYNYLQREEREENEKKKKNMYYSILVIIERLSLSNLFVKRECSRVKLKESNKVT